MDPGKRIAGLRADAGLSQETLAGRLFVSRSLVARWENGTRRPDRRSVEAMAELFGVPAESIAPPDPSAAAELSRCIPEGFGSGGDDPVRVAEAFLATLGARERDVFVRRYHFLERPAEIAERYGMGKGAVRTCLSRSRKKLRAFLEAGPEKEKKNED